MDSLWQRFYSQSERRWAQTGLGMLYAMWNTTYCTHFPALFMGLGLCLSCVCVCVSSASRNVCAPPILRWLPKTKMAARTPEKEKERWRQHAKCREKRNRLALSPPFRLLFFCLCECICPNLYTLYQIMLAWASVFPYHLQPPDKHHHKHTCTRSLP